MKKLFTICAILAMTALTGCGKSNETATTTPAQTTTGQAETTTEAKKAEYETLEKKDISSVGELNSVYETDDYKINLMEGWNQQESNGAALFTFGDKEVRIGITSSTLEKSGTLEECIENLCTLYEAVDNYTITGIDDITVNGLEGKVIQYKMEAEDFSYTGYQMIIKGAKSMFVITFVANTELYDGYVNQADDIISTFVEK